MTKKTYVMLPDRPWAKLSFIADLEDELKSEVARDTVGFYLDSEEFEEIDGTKSTQKAVWLNPKKERHRVVWSVAKSLYMIIN